MKMLEEMEHILSGDREELRQNYEVNYIGIFSSVVSGEQKKKNDIDVRPISLLGFVYLQSCLNDILDVKIDLVMRDSLKTRIGYHILNEVVMV